MFRFKKATIFEGQCLVECGAHGTPSRPVTGFQTEGWG